MSVAIAAVVGVIFKIAIIAFIIFYCVRKAPPVKFVGAGSQPAGEHVEPRADPERGPSRSEGGQIKPKNPGPHGGALRRPSSAKRAALISVGSKACPISKILQCLQSAASFPVFNEKWSDFARRLDVSNSHVRERKKDLFLGKLTLGDALFWMIEDWKGRKGSAATLQELIQALEDVCMKDCAEKLREEFTPDERFTTVEL